MKKIILGVLAVAGLAVLPVTVRYLFQSATKSGQMRLGLSALNHEQIVLFGKVVDQFGTPVPGAEVKGSTIYNTGFKQGQEKLKTVTDAKGQFLFDGHKGQQLGVNISKDGYQFIATNTTFFYSHLWPQVERHVHDPNKPVLFTSWKLQGAEPLIKFEFDRRIPCDGTPTAFDLQAGKIVKQGGDIVIRVERPPNPKEPRPYAWKATIQIVDGGLIPVREGTPMLLAPESGYQSEYVIDHEKSSESWVSDFTGSFFLKSRAGKSYGKFGVIIISDFVKDGTIPIILSGHINPAGSRNLEVDKTKVTEVSKK